MSDEAGPRTKSRDRAVIRGAIATGPVRITTVVASFLSLAISARFLTTDEFGLVAVLVSIWGIVTMFDLGVGGAFTTRLAASHTRADTAAVRGHVRHALLMLAAIGTVIAAGGAISAVVLPWHDWIGGGNVDSSTLTRSLIVTFVAAGTALPAALGTMYLNGVQRFATGQLVEAVGGVTALGATAVVALTVPTPEMFVFAALVCPLFVSLGVTAWISRGAFRRAPLGSGLGSAPLREMATAAVYYSLFNSANTASAGTTTLIVGATRGLSEAAVVSVAIRLFSPVITIIAKVGAQLWPSITSAISHGDVAWVRSRYRTGLIVITGASATASMVLFAVSPWFTELWVGASLVPSLGLCAWAAAFTTVRVLAGQVGVIVMAVERIRPAAAIAVCTAVVGVPVSILLAQQIGASGALIGATAAWLGILAPGLIILARRALIALTEPKAL